jgi:hypothetical protein
LPRGYMNVRFNNGKKRKQTVWERWDVWYRVIGRWMPDGLIDHGAVIDQVKIRGHRIEL